MSGFESTGKFMRPVQVGTTQRSRRRVRFRRVLLISLNLIFVAAIVGASVWVYQQTHQDQRFAIRAIEYSGAQNAPEEEIEAILQPYRGANLFRLQIEELERALLAVPWIAEVAIEKELPGTLRIAFVERAPSAIVRIDEEMKLIDAGGVIFAPFDPELVDREYPLIENSTPKEAAEAVAFLETLRARNPELYVRIERIEPAASVGWVVSDTLLDAPVRVGGERIVPKWTTLTEIAATEGLGPGGIEYADLRFARQIVVKHREETTGEREYGQD